MGQQEKIELGLNGFMKRFILILFAFMLEHSYSATCTNLKINKFDDEAAAIQTQLTECDTSKPYQITVLSPDTFKNTINGKTVKVEQNIVIFLNICLLSSSILDVP